MIKFTSTLKKICKFDLLHRRRKNQKFSVFNFHKMQDKVKRFSHKRV